MQDGPAEAVPQPEDGPGSGARMRADKWLCFARFFKTRTLAAAQISAGHLRVNGQKASKPAQVIGPGDVLTFPQGERIKVVRLLALPLRRGPAAEAQALYQDLTPPEDKSARNPAYEGKGRPSGKDRRNALLSRRPPLE